MKKPASEDSMVEWSKMILSTLKNEAREMSVKKLRKSVLKALHKESDDVQAKNVFKNALKMLEKKQELIIRDDGESVALVKNDKKRKPADLKESGTTIEDSLMNDGNQKKKKRKEDRKEKKSKDKGSRKESKSKSEGKDANKHDSTGGGKEEEKANSESKSDDEEKWNIEPKCIEMSGNKSKHEKEADIKNKPCPGNPEGITRLFLGNLPFKVDEESLSAFLPKTITHVRWITDKMTGKFYGSAFCEMDNSVNAAAAVAMNGSKLMQRAIRIEYSPARPGDVWPPQEKEVVGNDGGEGGGGGGGGGGSGGAWSGVGGGGRGKKALAPMSEKPDYCVKLFIGNLSYDIDDDQIYNFFASVGAEMKAVRWLTHRDTGDFKGCGYAEFYDNESCEKAATLNGTELLGRAIRIDWAQ